MRLTTTSLMTGKLADSCLVEVTNRRRDKRIFSTGCAGELYLPIHTTHTHIYINGCERLTLEDEQEKLNDCYFQQKDWRKCKKQVSHALSLYLVSSLPGLYLPFVWLPVYLASVFSSCLLFSSAFSLVLSSDLCRWTPFARAGSAREMTSEQTPRTIDLYLSSLYPSYSCPIPV